jgi:hypothetical protein
MKQQSKIVFAAVALLLAFMAALAGGAARQESVTVDEVAHIGAGVSYLQKFDLRMNAEHPPLAKVWAALPLALRGVHADYSSISWTFSTKMFNAYMGQWVFGDWLVMRWNDPRSTVFWARMPMLLMTLLLGFALYVYGARLGSQWGGLLCLCVYASMPTFLAFGPLVITDIAVALFWILAVWQLPEMWRSPSRGTVIKFGLVLAGAFLTKFSSGLLFFVFVAFALSLRWRGVPEQPVDKTALKAWRRRAWGNVAKATLWAAVFVYFFYLIFSWHQPTDLFSAIPHFPASAILRRVLMPVALYLRGLVLFGFSAITRPTYIWGHAYSHGVWFYFPALFILKSPMAFMLLLLLAIAVAIILKRRSGRQLPTPAAPAASDSARFESANSDSAIPAGMEMHWRALWVSLVVFVIVCMMNRLDISIRHFSIALALLVLMLAPLPRMLGVLRRSNLRGAGLGQCATIALAVASLVTAIWTYPNYFPFFNVLSRGKPKYLLVNDSNLDWNHAMPKVEEFVQRRGLKQILLDDYSFSEVTAYVPEAQVWSCQDPSAADGGRWAAVSASSIVDGHNCLWLMKYPHEALAGGSMYAIQLPPVIPAAGTPGGPPVAADYRYMGGVTTFDTRTMFLNFILDPQQLPPFMDKMQAQYEAQKKKK